MSRIDKVPDILRTSRLQLSVIEEHVCAIAADQLQFPRSKVTPLSRLIQDLNCDSLEIVELIMEMEDQFGVTLDRDANPFGKAVFTRQPFRISDLAELIYVQQGTGRPERRFWGQLKSPHSMPSGVPFTQLGGRWQRDDAQHLFERIESASELHLYRRHSDGMRCVLVPSATVIIGSDSASTFQDESPQHAVDLEQFLIDAEPVSTTAYCRFLNSIEEVDPLRLADWFALAPRDKRIEHVLIEKTIAGWSPVPDSETWPMILVSWHGANAYSLWANGRDWQQKRNANLNDLDSYLPTEAQWEYSARGASYREWPWGDDPPSQDRMRYAQHNASQEHPVYALPLASVSDRLGMSPFGLHHMAGNIWQWCRDWYDEHFYSTPEARQANPMGRTPTQVRSERGGSWVGPPELCRSSYRRGRPPDARGRCLGFRCVSNVEDLN